MAKLYTLAELLNTTDGMTVLRNNTAQDDGVDTVAGVDWFNFNGAVASNIYVSGNSYVGFGSNSEHLKVCRRDGKMWYLYRQEGVIGNTRFLKIRWQGYTYYNSTSSSYALNWELFLFDDGGMYLNLVKVPSDSGYLGTNQLICGSNTYNFTVAASTPVSYSFIPNASGGFDLSSSEYPVKSNYVSTGHVEFSTEMLKSVGSVYNSKITWMEDAPDGTSVSVYSKTSSGTYKKCYNGDAIAGLVRNTDYSEETLYIKVEMTTDDPAVTPSLSDLSIMVLAPNDDHILVLSFAPGITNNLQNSVGKVKCAYSGGTLRGVGGPVPDFELEFTPDGLTPKNNPNDSEHINISSVDVQASLIEVVYSDVKSNNEHVDIDQITVSAELIHVDDI